MKQSLVDRELRLIAKAVAKNRGWRSVSGIPYWTHGPLFYVLRLGADAEARSFHWTLRFKWLELDRLLWKVLDLTSNEREPFSLHANGAFTLIGHELHTTVLTGIDCLPEILAFQVECAATEAEPRAAAVADQITSIHSYLDFIVRENEEFVTRHPAAITNPFSVEAALVALATGDQRTALAIAEARVAAGDFGGFISGDRSFFERLRDICRAGCPSFRLE